MTMVMQIFITKYKNETVCCKKHNNNDLKKHKTVSKHKNSK